VSAVVTFYSYKGGVGRSMALANVAVLLASRGLRVLMVDWDLEAPGIENYFSYFNTDVERPGLLSMLMDAVHGPVDYVKYVSPIQGAMYSLSLIASGRSIDNDYSAKLERFDWDDFFSRGGGEFLESLRERWLADFDVVLIDSRTGLSDSGGICTIQLPDIIVGMFTANHQSLYGVRDILRLAQRARHSLAHDRSQISVIPLATRFGNDFRESMDWLDRTAEAMLEFYGDWLPAWASTREVVEQLKVPHVDYFGYGEKLAVIEQGTSDPNGMGFAYEKIAKLLANNLSNAEEVFQISPPTESPLERPSSAVESKDYEHDLYISFVHSAMTDEWLRPVLVKLRRYIGDFLGRDVSVFLDYRELEGGANWPSYVTKALARSRLLLAIVTPRYFRSSFSLAEWETFARREEQTKSKNLIVPVLIEGLDTRLPAWFTRRRHWDLRQMFMMRASMSTSHEERTLLNLAEHISSVLRNTPAFAERKITLPSDLDA
jgi:MinD-like ATPase involved in chromosome partitioning or flagellar assembly